MRIAVCDDDKQTLSLLSGIIEDYMQENDIRISYDIFSCGEELVDKIAEYDLFFLDCKMSDIDGLDFARLIRREFGYEKGIVFITAYSDFVYEAFEVRTHRYLLKPIQPEKVFEALDNYIASTYMEKKLLVKVDGRNDIISLKDVYYMEVSRKDVYIYLKEGFVVCHRTITSLEKELTPLGFYRIHRSYLVNADKVKSFDKRIVLLDNGEKIFMSPQKYNGFCKHYLKRMNMKIT
ncbi:MAG: response regulator transcription factor [Clostridia bacterium]|nr:response regulator transcription factor [Clostridia bacterium]